MNDQQLRATALNEATSFHTRNVTAEQVVESAKLFYAFLANNQPIVRDPA